MRQIYGNGRRGGWHEPASGAPMPFQRADGSRMTEEEIAAVAATDTQLGHQKTGGSPAPKGRKPTHDPVAIWKAVETHGTQVAAARALGMTQAGVQSGLARYMKAQGLTGPMPGLVGRATRPSMSESKKQTATATESIPGPLDIRPVSPDRFASEQADSEESLSDQFASERADESASEPGRAFHDSFMQGAADAARNLPATLTEAFEKAAEHERAARALPDEPEQIPVATVHMGDSEAHAKSFNEGYEAALAQYATIEVRAIDALVDWLQAHGRSWTQAEAERWFKALTSTIDLIYPTLDEAAG